MGDINGLIAGTEALDRAALLQAPQLEIISRCGVGLDNIDLQTASELGIYVFNTPDVHVDAVAALTMAGILNVLRQMSYADRSMRAGDWSKPMGRLLREKIVGIIGLGRVGKGLVNLLQPFKNQILAFDPSIDEKFAQAYGIEYCPLDELLTRSDIVSLHLPYSSEVYHLVDRSRLQSMKPTVVFVNCARGGIVDELALYEFLKENQAAGAYLDTFEQEPYEGPLMELSNVLLSPHMGTYAREVRTQMEMEAARNLCGFFNSTSATRASRGRSAPNDSTPARGQAV